MTGRPTLRATLCFGRRDLGFDRAVGRLVNHLELISLFASGVFFIRNNVSENNENRTYSALQNVASIAM